MRLRFVWGWERWTAVLLLLLLFAQTTFAARHTSITLDEPLHISSGYSILRTGDYRLIEEHPPLTKFIMAWPLLLLRDLPDPSQLPGWELEVATTDSLRLVRVAQELIFPYKPLDRLVFAARAPLALLALLLGALVYRWAADWFGPRGGLLALFMLTFDPNVLAHASVAATDLGAACFILLALYALQRFLRWRTWKAWLLAGLTLGLAQAAKLSAMMLLPVQALIILAHISQRSRTPSQYPISNTCTARSRKCIKSLILAYTGMVALAAGVLWALYGFQVGPAPELGLTLPAPGHAIPWLRLLEHAEGGHSAFLLGQVSHQGWWYYFPVALALKTPLPILLTWLASLAVLLLGQRRPWRDELALWLFPALYLALSLQSSLNIGYRHLLPILPLLAISSGRLARYLDARVWRLVAAGLGLWLLLGTVPLRPHYLAYFNELAGGPDGGYRYLVDSNTDWGQALKDLARYQEQHDVESVYLSMFTFLDPAIYDVRYEPLTPMHGDTPAVFPSRFNPAPGDYVISSTTLQGIPLADPEMYDWFRRREPDARIGRVMFLYHVPQAVQPGEWVAQCTTPVVPLPPPVVAEGFGRDDLRRTYFDCTQSWLLPAGGQTAGWYAFFRDTAMQSNPFSQPYLERARLSYEQKQPHAVPPFRVYEWAAGATLGADWQQSGIAAPSAWPPQQAENEGAAVSAPLALRGGPEWLGYRLDTAQARAGQSIELQSLWRVADTPVAALSLMAHLIAQDGRAVAVGDGLGAPIENWQAGDLIVQRHVLEIPLDTAPGTYWVQVGAYTLGDLTRLIIPSAAQDNADRIVLQRLEVVP